VLIMEENMFIVNQVLSGVLKGNQENQYVNLTAI
jgi:hypothetical protein